MDSNTILRAVTEYVLSMCSSDSDLHDTAVILVATLTLIHSWDECNWCKSLLSSLVEMKRRYHCSCLCKDRGCFKEQFLSFNYYALCVYRLTYLCSVEARGWHESLPLSCSSPVSGSGPLSEREGLLILAGLCLSLSVPPQCGLQTCAIVLGCQASEFVSLLPRLVTVSTLQVTFWIPSRHV